MDHQRPGQRRTLALQGLLYGGPPKGAGLPELLRAEVATRHRKAALWRLQVTDSDDEPNVRAEIEQWFDEHQPPIKRVRNSRAPNER
ncbi:hypothetical protein L3Q67_02140 [Saccharothrix sp. AJ9571]|nr:hypothetical protein L3Q67_02140 [Saccharothrix sp. AJ9571]